MHLRAILVFAFLGGLPAQDLAPFDGFLGSWTATGHFRQKPATAAFEWKRVLGGKFTTLEYTVSSGGKLVFAGHAFYHATAQGDWHDSNGAVYALKWKHAEGAVTVDWAVPNGPQGRSTYQPAANGSLTVTDAIQMKDGTWREFAQYELQRTRPVPPRP